MGILPREQIRMSRNYSQSEKDKILNQIKNASERCDGKLSLQKYKRVKDKDWASQTYIYNAFGSWNKAKKQLELDTNNIDVSKGRVEEELNKASKKTDGYLSASKFNEVSDISKRPVLRYFDTWKNALEEANIHNFGSKPSKQEIIDKMKHISKKYDGSGYDSYMSQQDFLEETGYTYPEFAQHFESWNEARKAANLPEKYASRVKYSREELINQLKEASGQVEGSLTFEKFKEMSEREIGTRTIQTRFGSWSKAKQEAGIQ